MGITKALRVVIHAFTFDHPVLTDMLIQAASRGGADVFVDKAAWQQNTGWIRERLALIDACPGACVYITTGHGCGRFYYEYRDRGYRVSNYPGKQHSKTVRVGPFELIGSCSWTVSSMGNQERDALHWNTARGQRDSDWHEMRAREHSVTLEQHRQRPDADGPVGTEA